MKTQQFFTATDHLTEEAIALYVDALHLDKTNELPTEILAHAANCFSCKQQIMEIYELTNSEQTAAAGEHPYFRRAKIFRFSYRIAAGFAIVLLGGSVYYYAIQPAEISTHAVIANELKKDSLTLEMPKREKTAPPTERIFAANFEPSKNLEDLIETEFRSASFQVFSPVSGKTVQQPVQFYWNGESQTVLLRILDNKENELLSETIHGSVYELKKKLSAGLYYWKLEANNELAYVGKFVIR